ncbi:ribosomal protein S27AE [Galbitalea soli]|nr:ribosomal protein S27AE [Galbitalea soli]
MSTLPNEECPECGGVLDAPHEDAAYYWCPGCDKGWLHL